ncbi:MAG TPA: TRC40/GET3/ArsA family transport-energizing ATPase, partial [Thermoanaerobaculia bacterium]|nr:TRC40/GET3/ArsA family transport-energizing ATPase [Thermoanaerobaculia bacterium]
EPITLAVLQRYVPNEGTAWVQAREELRRFFELSLPGIDELMAWMRIGELVEENEDAIVVVDTAPTGHALRMLAAAEHFAHFANVLDAMQEKHRGMVRQFTRRDVRDALDGFIEEFAAKARRRRELLTDRARAAFVPVFLSEPWVVEQTLRLMSEVEIAIPFAILNRAVLEADCELDVERQTRDAAARERIGIRVVDFARSCVPLWSAATAVAAIGNRRLQSPHSMTFFAGKGGVGKTTCASSFALQLARTKRVTLISVDPAHSVRDVFANETPPANLTVETIDTRDKWRRFRETLGDEIDRALAAIAPKGMTVAYDGEAMKQLVEIAPPGADEIFAITRLADLIADESVDAIVVDTAPTGHFLRLLDLPRTAGEWVRELMRILLRYKDLITPGSLGEELVRASRALKELEGTLRSDRAAVIVVTRPEPIVIAETARLIENIEQRGMQLAGVIANYVTPKNDCACDQTMRANELALVGGATVIERRGTPPVTLDELAGLFDVTSD